MIYSNVQCSKLLKVLAILVSRMQYISYCENGKCTPTKNMKIHEYEEKNKTKKWFQESNCECTLYFRVYFLINRAYFLTISNKLSRNFVFLKHTLLYTLYAQDFVRFKDNLFPAAYSSRFIQLSRYFVAGKITYTASISSNKWLKVEKNVEKSKTTKIWNLL